MTGKLSTHERGFRGREGVRQSTNNPTSVQHSRHGDDPDAAAELEEVDVEEEEAGEGCH